MLGSGLSGLDFSPASFLKRPCTSSGDVHLGGAGTLALGSGSFPNTHGPSGSARSPEFTCANAQWGTRLSRWREGSVQLHEP